MKTNPATQAPALTQTEPLPQLIAATANALPEQVDALARARAFAEPLLACETLDSGENTLVHADAVAAILKGIGGSEAMQAASYLVYACVHLNKPEEVIAKAFGDSFAALAVETTKLMRVQRQALAAFQPAVACRVLLKRRLSRLCALLALACDQATPAGAVLYFASPRHLSLLRCSDA